MFQPGLLEAHNFCEGGISNPSGLLGNGHVPGKFFSAYCRTAPWTLSSACDVNLDRRSLCRYQTRQLILSKWKWNFYELAFWSEKLESREVTFLNRRFWPSAFWPITIKTQIKASHQCHERFNNETQFREGRTRRLHFSPGDVLRTKRQKLYFWRLEFQSWRLISGFWSKRFQSRNKMNWHKVHFPVLEN